MYFANASLGPAHTRLTTAAQSRPDCSSKTMMLTKTWMSLR